ncbi:hypothetical protein UFOVP205_48 [uncultured Caudovirales phage]|uniref:HNH nuclease n=1 Tax=uncultured Caudovirales phage TaxID=2100421 RepID=A0A6J7WMT7_9CAUD|nr:hypothetical protein UFOVP205_48 [uncultured Caudovirales phage]
MKELTEEQRLKRNQYMKDWNRKKRGTADGANPGRPANSSDVLWSKVDVLGEDECWNWKGFKNDAGYGRTWINNRGYYAHRIIYDLVFPNTIQREAPSSNNKHGFLLHSCDNPSCCNPKHLRIGNHAENMADKVKRNRTPDYSGDKGPRCKLTMEQADEIRTKQAMGIPMKKLAKEFQLSYSSVKSIVSGRSYIPKGK